MNVSDGVWIPWRQRAGKLPDPAAAAPLSDYRSEQLHAVELAHSKKTHAYARTQMQKHIHANRACSTVN